MTMAVSAAHHFEVAVIGAGVVGLAVARALALKGKEVIILERNSIIGSETSSRSSEVVHAGLYYPPNSLKAKYCVAGKETLHRYCESRYIPFVRTGKLVVATQDKQLQNDLPKLQKNAESNGVDVKLMSREEVKDLEPEVRCIGALFSPSTAVFDSHSFMISLLSDAEHHGSILALNSKVTTCRLDPPVIRLSVDGTELSVLNVVNASGLWAHKIAQELHRDTRWKPPTQYFAKGNYFRLQGQNSPFGRPIYPVPEPGGLGVHATIHWDQSWTKFGPDVQWLDPNQDPDRIDFSCDESRGDEFCKLICKYWPDLDKKCLVPDYAGVRPKLYHPTILSQSKQSFVDFCFAQPSDHNVNGLFHCFGMESPGLTSSMAIASHIADQVCTRGA